VTSLCFNATLAQIGHSKFAANCGVKFPMSVSDFDKIDFVGVCKNTGKVSLTISDHLDWTDLSGHLQILQEKIYRYAEAIDSGEIHRKYPGSKENGIEINVVFMCVLPERTKEFMFDIGNHLGKDGIVVKYEQFKT